MCSHRNAKFSSLICGLILSIYILYIVCYASLTDDLDEIIYIDENYINFLKNDTKMHLEYKWTPKEMIDQRKTKVEYIDTINDWLSTLDNPTVPKNIQDETIILFLLSCDNAIELTKKTVVSFYECKKNGSEIYDDRNINRNDIQRALNTVHLSSIPVRTDENYVIHYFKVNDTNYNNFDLVPLMKVSYMLVDVAQEKNPPDGLIVLIDMKGMSFMHMTRIRIGAIKKYLQFLQDGFPMKMKVIHILNAVYFIDKLLDLVKVFMKSELINMIKIHLPGLEEEKLFEMIPKKCLPKEYGGDLPSERDLHYVTLEQFRNKQEFWYTEEKIRKSALNRT